MGEEFVRHFVKAGFVIELASCYVGDTNQLLIGRTARL